MKTRKSLLTLLVAIFTLCVSMFVFSACEVATPHTHTWGEWQVVTPSTCLAEGDEMRVCTTDASHVENRKIPKSGHSGYILCVDCGEIIVNQEDTQFYGNSLQSLIDTKSFGLVVEDVDFYFEEAWAYDYNYDGIIDESSETSIDLSAQFGEVVVGYKEDGTIYAYGDGEVTLIGNYLPIEPMSATAYFEGTVGYFKLNAIEEMFVKLDATTLMQVLEEMLSEQNFPALVDQVVAELKTQVPVDLYSAIDEIALWLKDDPVGDISGIIADNEQLIKKIFASSIAPALKKTQVANGYDLTLDFDILRDVNNDLYSKTIEDYLEEEYGINPLVKIRSKIDGVLNTTVGEIITDVETELGMTFSEFINEMWVELGLPEEIEGLTKQDIIDVLSATTLRNSTIKSLLQDLLYQTEGVTASIDEFIDEIFTTLEQILDYTIYEMMFMSVYEEPDYDVSIPGYAAAPGVMPDTDQMLLMVKESVDDVIDVLEDVCNFVLHTDAQGNVKSITYSADFDLNDIMQALGGGSEAEDVALTVSGDVSLICGYQTQDLEDYQAFKADAESFFNKIDISSTKILDQLKAHYGEDNVTYQDGMYSIYSVEEGSNTWGEYTSGDYTYYYEDFYHYEYNYVIPEQALILVAWENCNNVVALEMICQVECEYYDTTYYVVKDALGTEVSRDEQ
jgi:hypothetical protein